MVEPGAESGHRHAIVFGERDLLWILSTADTVSFQKVPSQHGFENRRCAGEDDRRNPKASELELEDNISFGGYVGDVHRGWLWSRRQ